MGTNNFLGTIFIALLFLPLLTLPAVAIWLSNLLLLRTLSELQVLLIWSILILTCIVLWIVGKKRERQSENPLKNILEHKNSNFLPTGRLRKNFLLFCYKRKRQNNHKMII